MSLFCGPAKHGLGVKGVTLLRTFVASEQRRFMSLQQTCFSALHNASVDFSVYSLLTASNRFC
eukprot:7269763-Prymnesium_polylepis.1